MITYTPNFNFIGIDEFVYQVADDQGEFGSATVFVQVNNTNDAPQAVDQQLTMDEDGSLQFTLNGSDPDGDILSYTFPVSPANGV
jgi:hypothetical protein